VLQGAEDLAYLAAVRDPTVADQGHYRARLATYVAWIRGKPLRLATPELPENLSDPYGFTNGYCSWFVCSYCLQLLHMRKVRRARRTYLPELPPGALSGRLRASAGLGFLTTLGKVSFGAAREEGDDDGGDYGGGGDGGGK
jgi:hypothetical protein